MFQSSGFKPPRPQTPGGNWALRHFSIFCKIAGLVPERSSQTSFELPSPPPTPTEIRLQADRCFLMALDPTSTTAPPAAASTSTSTSSSSSSSSSSRSSSRRRLDL